MSSKTLVLSLFALNVGLMLLNIGLFLWRKRLRRKLNTLRAEIGRDL